MARVRETREPEDGRAAPLEPAAPVAAPGVEAVLRLQAQAGNRATTRLIGRAPEAETEAEPREQTKASGSVLTVDGLGSYELSSFQTTGKTAIVATLNPGKDAARLMSAASKGEPIKTVTVTVGGRTIRLTGVVITSIQYSGDPSLGEPLVTVGFDGKSLEFE